MWAPLFCGGKMLQWLKAWITSKPIWCKIYGHAMLQHFDGWPYESDYDYCPRCQKSWDRRD
jgi:hypothetical protein